MIEVKTLLQYGWKLEDLAANDGELATYLNDGWQIVRLESGWGPPDNFGYDGRVILLTRGKLSGERPM